MKTRFYQTEKGENEMEIKPTWSLYIAKPCKNYPSKLYLWINPQGIITYWKEITPIGFLPAFSCENLIGKTKKDIRGLGFKKISNHRMNDDQLSEGCLFL
jgi:hypothetical protein